MATGLLICSLLATVAHLASGKWSEDDSLSQATQLWDSDISEKITPEEMKRAIKAELSSSFSQETQNLKTALSSSQYPTKNYLLSSSDDQR